ncbi:4657_t:CDS:1 [Funneliformis geosporum]|uniref:746_t:CDS:1 n=1 Tax=Funneliformis geosporum TaxID=1117311 RepID=A0A9W4SS80_9GLOM|nr:4657_t:CDS:1 [Funneliformis geosporum]CAI2178688.1 746_t:CDS:1 [Funneliformis geosporum]
MNENNSDEDLQEILPKKQLQQQKMKKCKEEYNHEDLQETTLNKQQYQLQKKKYKDVYSNENLQEISLKRQQHWQQKFNKYKEYSNEDLHEISLKEQQLQKKYIKMTIYEKFNLRNNNKKRINTKMTKLMKICKKFYQKGKNRNMTIH